jgi:hypothetical protein
MDGQDDHLSYHGDLEHLDHLECLGGSIEGEDDQDTQGAQHSHGRRLEHLPFMRSPNNSANVRPARTSADVV